MNTYVALKDMFQGLAVAVPVLLVLSGVSWYVTLKIRLAGWRALRSFWFVVVGGFLFLPCLSALQVLGQAGMIGVWMALVFMLLGWLLTCRAVARTADRSLWVWLASGVSLASAVAVFFVQGSFLDRQSANDAAGYTGALTLPFLLSTQLALAGLGTVVFLSAKAGENESHAHAQP